MNGSDNSQGSGAAGGAVMGIAFLYLVFRKPVAYLASLDWKGIGASTMAVTILVLKFLLVGILSFLSILPAIYFWDTYKIIRRDTLKSLEDSLEKTRFALDKERWHHAETYRKRDEAVAELESIRKELPMLKITAIKAESTTPRASTDYTDTGAEVNFD